MLSSLMLSVVFTDENTVQVCIWLLCITAYLRSLVVADADHGYASVRPVRTLPQRRRSKKSKLHTARWIDYYFSSYFYLCKLLGLKIRRVLVVFTAFEFYRFWYAFVCDSFHLCSDMTDWQCVAVALLGSVNCQSIASILVWLIQAFWIFD